MEKVTLGHFMGPGLCLRTYPHSSFERTLSLSTFPIFTQIARIDPSFVCSGLWLVWCVFNSMNSADGLECTGTQMGKCAARAQPSLCSGWVSSLLREHAPIQGARPLGVPQ